MSTPTSTQALRASPSWLTAALVVAVMCAMIGAGFGDGETIDAWHWLHWLCKPLATILVIAMVWSVRLPVSPTYRQRVLAGMVFSLVGDVFLMLSPRWFIAGLLGFLIAHVGFIAAFVSDKPFAAKPLPWLLCVAYGALAVWMLWPSLAPVLRFAVPLYIAVLATMAGQAVGRAGWFRARCATLAPQAVLAACGALVFMLSDSLLAWNRFMAPLPLSAVAVLGTYYAALWLIARSVDASTTLPTTQGIER